MSNIPFINDSSLVYIAINCNQLDYLDVSGTAVSSVSLRIFATKCQSLRELYLDECKEVGNEALASIYGLESLRNLSLCSNYNITQYGILQLALRLKSLKSLDISLCSNVSDVTVMKVRTISPNLELKFKFK